MFDDENYLEGLNLSGLQSEMPEPIDVNPLTYTVQKGDNLWNLMEGDVDLIRRLSYENQLKDPNKIYVGQELVAPSSDTDDDYNRYMQDVYTPAMRRYYQQRQQRRLQQTQQQQQNQYTGVQDVDDSYDSEPMSIEDKVREISNAVQRDQFIPDDDNKIFGYYKEDWDQLPESYKEQIAVSNQLSDFENKQRQSVVNNIRKNISIEPTVNTAKSAVNKNRQKDVALDYLLSNDAYEKFNITDAFEQELKQPTDNIPVFNQQSQVEREIMDNGDQYYDTNNPLERKLYESNIDQMHKSAVDTRNQIHQDNINKLNNFQVTDDNVNEIRDFARELSDNDLNYYIDNTTNNQVKFALNGEKNKREFNPNGFDNKQKLYSNLFGLNDNYAMTYDNNGNILAIDQFNNVVSFDKDPVNAFVKYADDIMSLMDMPKEIIDYTNKRIKQSDNVDEYNDIVNINALLYDNLKFAGQDDHDINNTIRFADILNSIQNQSYTDYYQAEKDAEFLSHFGDIGQEIIKYLIESLPKQSIDTELIKYIPGVIDPSYSQYSQDALKLANKYLSDQDAAQVFNDRLYSSMNAIGTIGFNVIDFLTMAEAGQLVNGAKTGIDIFNTAKTTQNLGNVGKVINKIGSDISRVASNNKILSSLNSNYTLNVLKDTFNSARLWKNSGFVPQLVSGIADATILNNITHNTIVNANNKFDIGLSDDTIDALSYLTTMALSSLGQIQSQVGAKNTFNALKNKKTFNTIEKFFFENKDYFENVLSSKYSQYIGSINRGNLLMQQAGYNIPDVLSYAFNDKNFYDYLTQDKEWNGILGVVGGIVAGGVGSSATKQLAVGSKNIGKTAGMHFFEASGGTDDAQKYLIPNLLTAEDRYKSHIGIRDVGLPYTKQVNKFNSILTETKSIKGPAKIKHFIRRLFNDTDDEKNFVFGTGKINQNYIPDDDHPDQTMRKILFDKCKQQFPEMSDKDINSNLDKTFHLFESKMKKAQNKAAVGWFTERKPYTQIFVNPNNMPTQSANFGLGIRGLNLTDINYKNANINPRFGKLIETSIIDNNGNMNSNTPWGDIVSKITDTKYYADRLKSGRSVKMVFLGNPEVLNNDYTYFMEQTGREIPLFINGKLNPEINIDLSQYHKSGQNYTHNYAKGNAPIGKAPIKTSTGNDMAVYNNMKGHVELPIRYTDKDGNKIKLALMIDVEGMESGGQTGGAMKKIGHKIIDNTPDQQLITFGIAEKNGSNYKLWDKAAVDFTKDDVEIIVPKGMRDLIELNNEIQPMKKAFMNKSYKPNITLNIKDGFVFH